ncbi:multifunctional CCA tRNA nucleotidyl transferase/2'3'-cyclic phosphodiesterase/2'nucleotidase/phosphatase [Marinobacter salinexigens]|uniref:CCA-adding enzyme n=1 Tax=Marinobacter salinexigens TaxID=2919747 RepID=A0A5B0VN86_9GAMM|nr:multifunctional CCA tRNA nucleotidyl transferase/2'3'-cyclic phosphodiesterase/2'nucleotidase/phosphatase [Marinobacter salinexigens]KAA1175893.1 multifunctional CCA tRNA nucleotidyl transferase/2'3'-cyclic phosphodiesterase/2'nucleotidase/phosphatase [Marinobacter salinexigens]
MQTYLVGGAVRDKLLGLDVEDRDWVVVGATPEEMLQKGFKQVGADFPVFLHPRTREEYALARTERKQGRGYHGFSVYSAPDVTLEEDLKRRDLTINAMAMDEQDQLVDPFDGKGDIERRLLRHVSDAFAEDPLRILRTARFAARFQPLGFRVSPETMQMMRSMVSEGEVNHLVSERVWQEIQRALNEKEPGTFFEVLQDCGALQVLIPELASPSEYQAGLNALRLAHHANGSTEERFAALMSPLDSQTCTERAATLKAPNDCRDLARLTTLFAPDVNTGQPPTPDSALALLNHADSWRRPERFASLLKVLSFVHPERLRSIKMLQAGAEAATQVDPKALMQKGFKGKALGNAIQAERLARIGQAFTM